MVGQVEIWKPVPSIDGLEASSHGRVRCIRYAQIMPHGGHRIRSFGPSAGCVSYGAKGSMHKRMIFRFRGKTYKVHRAVCEAFHGVALFDRAVVMHVDENSFNNNPENLRWGTQKENLNAPLFRALRCASAQRRAA